MKTRAMLMVVVALAYLGCATSQRTGETVVRDTTYMVPVPPLIKTLEADTASWWMRPVEGGSVQVLPSLTGKDEQTQVILYPKYSKGMTPAQRDSVDRVVRGVMGQLLAIREAFWEFRVRHQADSVAWTTRDTTKKVTWSPPIASWWERWGRTVTLVGGGSLFLWGLVVLIGNIRKWVKP